MNYIQIFLSFLLLLSLPVCNRRTESPEGTAAQGGGAAGQSETLIRVSRDHFTSSGMGVSDPSEVLIQDEVHATGTVRATPSGRAEVNSLIPGRIHRIHHAVGEAVSAGDVLFTLESNEYIELQQEYATVSNRVKLLKVEFERQKTLFEQQVVAEKEFLRTESEYRSTLSMMEGLKARLQMVHTDPGQVETGIIVPYLKVLSPINGTITGQELVMGHYVTPGEVVTEVVDPGTLMLYLQVFEKNLEEIRPGQQVLFFTPDRSGTVKEATLLQVGRSIDPVNKKVLCTARINKEDAGGLVNNLFVETRIIVNQREVLAVPEEAVLQIGESAYILTLVEEEGNDMIFRAVEIPAGPARNGYVEVKDPDLKQVLIRGAFDLWTGN